MNTRIRIAALLTVLLPIFAATIPAQSTAPSGAAAASPTTRISQEMLDRLQSDLGKVKTVQADFVQEKRLAVMNHVLKISGHFALQKPDRLLWSVTQPVRYAICIEGDEVRQWDQDTNHVDVIHVGGDPTFKAVSDQIQAWFLGDYAELAKNYDVDVLAENPLSLVFKPRAGTMVAKVLDRVQISFAKDDQYIDGMEIDEAGGDKTTVQFLSAQINQPIADDVWRIPPNEH